MAAGVAGVVGSGKSIVRDSSLINWIEPGLVQSYLDLGINWFTYSEDFTNAAWSKSSVTVTGNATTGPTVDGVVLNADKIVETAVTQQFLLYTVPYTATVGDVNTFSVFAKAAERTQLTITANGEGYAVFNLDTGTIYQTGGHVCSIESYGNGWYRCRATIIRTNVSSSNVYLGSWKNNTNVYLGTLTQGLYVAGAQFEKNRVYLGTYKKTVASTVITNPTTLTDLSSNAKNLSLVGSPQFNGNHLTFAAASTQYGNYAATIAAASLTACTICLWVYPTAQGQLLSVLGQSGFTTGYHHCAMDIASTGVFGFGLWNNTAVSKVSSAAQSLNRWHHLAITYASTTMTAYLNGASVGSPTAFTWVPPTNVLFFGLMNTDGTICNVAAAYGTGRVGHFSVYNRALSAAEVGQNYNAGLGMYGS